MWVLADLLPGDPATAVLGPQASPERVAQLRADRGLDRPVLVQLGDWLAGLPRGDLGNSLISGDPVTPLVVDRAVNSAALLTATIALVVLVAVPLGVLAGLRADRPAGALLSAGAVVAVALPDFVVATLLVLWLAVDQGLLPAVALLPPGTSAWQRPEALVVPTLALSLGVGGWVVRHLRAVVAEQDAAPHVAAARLAGLPERLVLLRHLLPGAVAPVLQLLGWTAALLLGGAVVVERVVGLPGLGSLLVEATVNRDLVVVTAVAGVMALAAALALLAADLLADALDPRRRRTPSGGDEAAARERAS